MVVETVGQWEYFLALTQKQSELDLLRETELLELLFVLLVYSSEVCQVKSVKAKVLERAAELIFSAESLSVQVE